jgi:hypothetical protein
MSNTRGLLIVAAAFGGFFLVLFIVFKVLNTEFFRGDPELGGSAQPIVNEKTALAFARCVERAAKDLRLAPDRSRPPAEYTAWDIGFDRYLVKATVEDGGTPPRGRTFLCKISDPGGAEVAGWEIQSLEFLN